MFRNSTILLGLLLFVQACVAPSLPPARPSAADVEPEIRVPPPPKVAPISQSQGNYYRKVFPQASQFASKAIPPAKIPEMDEGNDTFVEVLGNDGVTIGYLRDFVGPISPKDSCACEPLKLTMAYDAELKFIKLLTPVPLTKYGHTVMNDRELKRLEGFAKKPPGALLQIRDPDDLIDAETGATVRALRKVVIPEAGLATWRIVNLVQTTRTLIQNSALIWDQDRLQTVQATYSQSPSRLQKALALFIPSTESYRMARHAYRLLVNLYTESLLAGAPPDPEVEHRLLDPLIAKGEDEQAMVDGCYQLLNSGLRPVLVNRCVRALEAIKPPLTGDAFGRLVGTLNLAAGELTLALPALESATTTYSVEKDPLLHRRYASALFENDERQKACSLAKELFMGYALVDGLTDLLKKCAGDEKPNAFLKILAEEKKQIYLSTRLFGEEKVPTLALETDEFAHVEMPLYEDGKVTVALFFATWCGHCQKDLPKVKAFVQALEERPELQSKVRIVGVRTAIEKESMDYHVFKKRFALNFPFWTDPVMALAFSQFSRSQGLPTSLPTLAVIDEKGFLQYQLDPGTFRDTQTELLWSVEDVLANPKKSSNGSQ